VIRKRNRRACARRLSPPGIALTPSAAPGPSARAPEKPDPTNPRSRAGPQFQSHQAFSDPNFNPPLKPPRRFRFPKFFPSRFSIRAFKCQIRFNIRSIRCNFSINFEVAKSQVPFRLLLLYRLTCEMSRMCCSFCSVLPTFFVATKEILWNFYESNAKGTSGTLHDHALPTRRMLHTHMHVRTHAHISTMHVLQFLLYFAAQVIRS
jgi:hypothetical protein